MSYMETFRQSWDSLRERIELAADRVGRDPQEIAVVAVTKTRTCEEVEIALRSGVRIVGENRIQEAEVKKAQVRSFGQWHLIGHLQTNKAPKAVALFDMVQSVDRLKLATALDQRAEQAGRTLDILVQVNTSGAVGQSGIAPENLLALAEQIAPLPNLRLCGLMTIGAFSKDETVVRSCFSLLRQLADQVAAARIDSVEMRCLSMGMSSDFELAIAEGANMLRLGTVLFGPRPA